MTVAFKDRILKQLNPYGFFDLRNSVTSKKIILTNKAPGLDQCGSAWQCVVPWTEKSWVQWSGEVGCSGQGTYSGCGFFFFFLSMGFFFVSYFLIFSGCLENSFFVINF